METGPATRTAILERVAVLEDRYGRITAGRIVIRARTHHHSKGAAFEVHIHLSLPNGREVNVAVTPGEDERHADPPLRHQ